MIDKGLLGGPFGCTEEVIPMQIFYKHLDTLTTGGYVAWHYLSKHLLCVLTLCASTSYIITMISPSNHRQIT